MKNMIVCTIIWYLIGVISITSTAITTERPLHLGALMLLSIGGPLIPIVIVTIYVSNNADKVCVVNCKTQKEPK